MAKEIRHLITTEDERTWKFDRPVLFTGEWCRLYDKRAIWGEMDAEVLQHQWIDKDKLYSDYLYLDGLYEVLLILLAEKLNQVHSVNKEVRYWRILVGPWLAMFIQILFDRWSSVTVAVSHFEVLTSTVIEFKDSTLVPNDMGHFVEIMQGCDWNHYIYSSILEEFPTIFCSKKVLNHSNEKVSSRGKFRSKISNIYSHFTNYLVKENDAFLKSTYLPTVDVARLSLRLGQFPQMWKSTSPVWAVVDVNQRDWKLTIPESSKFEEFALAMIPKQIPTIFLEGYKQLKVQTDLLSWPKRPKVIFTSNALWYDTVTMAYVAEKTVNGAPLVYGQHGGLYGVCRFSWAEKHEVAISDRYLTWGWSDSFCQKVRAIGMLKRQKIRNFSSNTKKRLLFVSLTKPKQTYLLTSDTMVMSKNFISNCLTFASNLADVTRSSLLVRLHDRDNGWGQASQWRNRFPNIQLDLGSRTMKGLLRDARLAVYTYNSTGYLETFAANIPTVLFWDTKLSTLRPSAIPYFADLKSVGIFHETPESAARHVNKVWDDVDGWWLSLPVQEVLARFTVQYCNAPKNMLTSIQNALCETASTSKNNKI
ncbi:LIC12162 family protein [Candidatus Njordibacter sp. Uisw_039]|uniref:LIC12162 family transferase n=1 Tax=Candidatus Njordibacter sp. Uisw_039 TaxID=3230972 RepID=UPI003D4E8112